MIFPKTVKEDLVVSAAMAIQDRIGGACSNSTLQEGNGIFSDGLHNVTGVQVKEQLSCGSDYAPKVRKPYTITKQRERWTELEHMKFLEALKLYGRAWRQIEELVGTKTAVQIRSHAQKFFSKVVRESTGSNTSPLETIEIPPPRPKRKPVHPYPRKLGNLHNIEMLTLGHSVRSASPNFSISDKDNRSATSVLSAVGSDVLGSTEDSNTPNGGLSPVSSVADFHPGGLVIPEQKTPPVQVIADSCSEEKHHVKLELFTNDSCCLPKEVSGEEVSAHTLKLFGRTIFIADSHISSSPIPGTCKSSNHCMIEEKEIHERTMCEGSPIDFQSFHGTESMNEDTNSDFRRSQDKEIQKEGSWTNPKTGSVNGENAQRSSDIETQSCQSFFVKEEKDSEPVFKFKPSNKSASSEVRGSLNKVTKGFVPYQRYLTERHGCLR